MPTKLQMIARVAEMLRIAPLGSPLPAEDSRTIEQDLGDIIAALRREGVATWTIDSIPDFAALPLAVYVAGLVAPKYYSEASAVAPFLSQRDGALKALRSMTQQREISEEYVHKAYF